MSAIKSTGPRPPQEMQQNQSLWLKKCNKKGPGVPIGCEFFAKAKLSEQTIDTPGPLTLRTNTPPELPSTPSP